MAGQARLISAAVFESNRSRIQHRSRDGSDGSSGARPRWLVVSGRRHPAACATLCPARATGATALTRDTHGPKSLKSLTHGQRGQCPFRIATQIKSTCARVSRGRYDCTGLGGVMGECTGVSGSELHTGPRKCGGRKPRDWQPRSMDRWGCSCRSVCWLEKLFCSGQR